MMEFIPWIVGIAGVILAIVSQYFAAQVKGRADGERKAEQQLSTDRDELAANAIKRQDAAQETQIEAITKANDVQSEVNQLDSNSAASELRNNWTRD